MLTVEIVVAVLGFIGSLIGTIVGIVTSNSLTTHRLGALEKKVDEFNSISVRVSILEKDNSTQWAKINEMHDDIKMIRKEVTKERFGGGS